MNCSKVNNQPPSDGGLTLGNREPCSAHAFIVRECKENIPSGSTLACLFNYRQLLTASPCTGSCCSLRSSTGSPEKASQHLASCLGQGVWVPGSKRRGAKVLCDGGAGEGDPREHSHNFCVGHSLRTHRPLCFR